MFFSFQNYHSVDRELTLNSIVQTLGSNSVFQKDAGSFLLYFLRIFFLKNQYQILLIKTQTTTEVTEAVGCIGCKVSLYWVQSIERCYFWKGCRKISKQSCGVRHFKSLVSSGKTPQGVLRIVSSL